MSDGVRVVAEAGQCMGSSVRRAADMARQARAAGAWGFKVQLLQPDEIATPWATPYWRDTLGKTTQAEAFRDAGVIGYQEWGYVAEVCNEVGIEFIGTPFDHRAVDALAELGCRYVKIASGDITYRQLLQHVNEVDWHVILSTGASTLPEVARALELLHDVDVTLLVCTLEYPTPLHAANLARITTLRHTFPGHVIGYSDHTSLPNTALAAAALGAELIEVHYTTTPKSGEVADNFMAVDPQELRRYVEHAWTGHYLRGDAKFNAPNERAAREGARRSVVAAREIRRGEHITARDVAFRRPGTGVSPDQVEQVLGTATRDYAEGDLIV